jgi:hypothetical protein
MVAMTSIDGWEKGGGGAPAGLPNPPIAKVSTWVAQCAGVQLRRGRPYVRAVGAKIAALQVHDIEAQEVGTVDRSLLLLLLLPGAQMATAAASADQQQRCQKGQHYYARERQMHSHTYREARSRRGSLPRRRRDCAAVPVRTKCVLYFSYSGYNQTLLNPVFGADHDARIRSGQGRRQLAAFQRQSRVKGGISPLAGRLAGRQPCEMTLRI